MKHTKLLLACIVVLAAHTASAQVITTIAGTGTRGYSGDSGPALMAELNDPNHLFIDHSNNIFVADGENSVIRKINPEGIITTVAGNGTPGYSGDGGLAIMAQLFGPIGVTVDDTGSIYILDINKAVVRKVDTFGIITTVAGSYGATVLGDGGPATAAALYSPMDITIDSSGNLYIADNGNIRIRKINTSGIITTIAGNGTAASTGDNGPATAASLNGAVSVAVDRHGDIFVGEGARIRKINSLGIITTIAGTGGVGYSGDNGPATAAQFDGPTGMTIDSIGNLYFADNGNNRIRKIDTAGVITTVAGNGMSGFSGDGGNPLLAKLYGPWDVKLNRDGNIVITDAANYRIRAIMGSLPVNAVNAVKSDNGINIYPNPSHGKINVMVLAANTEIVPLVVTNVLGQKIKEVPAIANKLTEITLDAPPGIYFLSATTSSGHFTEKIIIQN